MTRVVIIIKSTYRDCRGTCDDVINIRIYVLLRIFARREEKQTQSARRVYYHVIGCMCVSIENEKT